MMAEDQSELDTKLFLCNPRGVSDDDDEGNDGVFYYLGTARDDSLVGGG